MSCNIKIIFPLLLLSLFFACTKQGNNISSSSFSNDSIKQKVLIELYTGHNDGHSSLAMQKIIDEQNKHGNSIIPIVIQGGFFAKPSKLYPEDFRSSEANEYIKFWNVIANPVLTVNRIGYPSSPLINYSDAWQQLSDNILNKSPAIDLQISNSYNFTTRLLNISVQYKLLQPIKSNCKLVVLFVQDSLVGAQKDYFTSPPNYIPNYMHRYVLRHGITNLWGDLIYDDTFSIGPEYNTKLYSYYLPKQYNNTLVTEKNCFVVAYIYNTSTYEIIQAESKKII